MLVNTQYFREAALDYKKNGGEYTHAPYKSRDFMEYWQEQDRRCREGYTVGDVSITGRYYYYLNFTPILRIPDKALKERNKISAQVEAVQDFPGFWEIQYNWWWAKEIAMKGIKKAEFERLGLLVKIPDKYLVGGKHISCAKTRGCGFSYMESADGTYNYNFIPGSKSFYFASQEGYLTGDGILTKCWDNLEWLNNKSQNFWRKNRQKKNTDMHKKASYLDTEGNEKGYKSEIMGVIVDDPNKVRGKRGMKLSFEESGSFKKLKSAIEIARPLVEQGGFMRGQISVFGTGGEEGESIEGLEDIFYKPDLYNMMAFENIWDGEELEGTTCGFFVPCTLATDKFIDEDGNSDVKAAEEHWDAQRAIKKKDPDPKALDRLVAERPKKPSEAFQRVSSNIFLISEVNKQIARIKANRDIQGLIQHGIMVPKDGSYDFQISSEVKPILKFPHKNDEDLTGCVTVIERPFKDRNGHVPENLYIIVVDPYYKDDAEDRTSLGDVRVILRNNNLTGTQGNRTVAWYTARPTLETFHRNLFALAKYYNAKIQSEIGGGGQGIIDYARANKKHGFLDMLEHEPEMLHNREIATNSKNRGYFMNMTTERKKQGLIYLAEKLREPIAITESGEVITNYSREYDLNYLEELKRYNDIGNFDRISSNIVGVYMLKEKAAIEVEEARQTSGFFNRPLFSDYPSGSFDDLATLGVDIEPYNP